MFVFEDNELEIALVTYNRPMCVDEWLRNNIDKLIEDNIQLCIYDSSINNDTYDVVANINFEKSEYIRYFRVDSNITIGEKPLYAIKRSRCTYVWICVDRRCADLEEMEKYVFPYIAQNKYATILIPDSAEANDINKEYSIMRDFISDGIMIMTHLGDIIYKKSIFNEVSEYVVSRISQEEYRDSFEFLEYHLQALALSNCLCKIRSVKHRYSNEKTHFSWRKNMLKYILDDLVCVINDAPAVVIDKDYCIQKAINEVRKWIIVNPSNTLYDLRINSDLGDIYQLFLEKGYWNEFSEIKEDIDLYATEDIERLKYIHLFERKGECTDAELYDVLDKNIEILKAQEMPIYIYGAGYGGKLVYEYLIRNNLLIAGFIDSNSEKLENANLAVFSIDEIDLCNCYIIVSIKKIIMPLRDMLFGKINKERILYLCEELLA